MELHERTIHELQRMLRDGGTTAVEIYRSVFARIDAVELFRSDDDGATWQNLGAAPPNVDATALLVPPGAAGSQFRKPAASSDFVMDRSASAMISVSWRSWLFVTWKSATPGATIAVFCARRSVPSSTYPSSTVVIR